MALRIPAIMTRRMAEAPFDTPNADLVLRSSDDVSFGVQRAILAEASPIFEDMLSIPQPPPVRTPDPASPTGPPVVDLTETSRALDHLLRFCYPVDNPDLPTAEDVFGVLEAAKKYMMGAVVRAVHARWFAAHAEREPMRMYVGACRRGWEDEMRLAARASLARPFVDFRDVRELEEVSAGSYLRLQAYHRACRKAAASLHYAGVDFSSAHHARPRRIWYTRKSKRHGDAHVEPWWTEYMERAREALLVRPCGATVLTPELSYKFLLDVVAKLPLHERTRILFDLTPFNLEFAECIDRAVSQVRHKGLT